MRSIVMSGLSSDPIVIAIDSEQEYDRGKLRHLDTSLDLGLCQQPFAAIRTSASVGPQLPCL